MSATGPIHETARVRAIGCMTGTSCDGVDVALVEVDTVALRATLIDAASVSLRNGATPSLGDRLRAARGQAPLSAAAWTLLAHDAALAHIDAIRPLVDRHGPPDLIAIHGQTVSHAPPLSWQLCNPWPVAAAFGVRVIYDLRGADIAQGGDGAPLVPFADWVLFRGDRHRAIVNLGGFANVSLLPAASGVEQVRGADLAPCCQWLDGIARTFLGSPCDVDGAAASAGSPDGALAAEFAGRLTPAAAGSLGTDAESHLEETLDAFVARARAVRLSPKDATATATDAIAQSIARRLRQFAEPAFGRTPFDVLVAGGGAFNGALLASLATHAACPIATTQAAGVPPAFREAAAWAILGACRDSTPVTLPAVTGRTAATLLDGAEVRPRPPSNT